MICIPGRCIKCNCTISAGSAPGHMYSQIHVRLDDGTNLAIGCCANCQFEDDDYQVAVNAVSAAMKGLHDGKKFVELIERKSLKDIAYERQQGKCLTCLQDLGESFRFTHGNLYHEHCNTHV